MIKKKLKTLSQTAPNFNKQHLQNAVNSASIGWTPKTRTVEEKLTANSIITDSNKSSARSTLNLFPYLNLGPVYINIEAHAQNLLNGSLGETSPEDTTTPRFIEHLGLCNTIESILSYNFDTDAENTGKGVNDHFGTLNQKLDEDFKVIRESIQTITNRALSTDTLFQNAVQALSNYIDTVQPDSTSFNQATFDSKLSDIQTTATNFDAVLAGDPILLIQKNNLIEKRKNIVNRITKETTNLGVIRTYTNSLVDTISLLNFVENSRIRNLISITSGSTDWQEYFKNYEKNFSQLNPLSEQTASLPATQLIADTLRLKGLPDVKTHIDLDSVAQKAKRDERLSKKNYDRLSSEQIITQASKDLGLSTSGKDIYSQSKQLLNNLNQQDIIVIDRELSIARDLDTIS
jgi:hypothetical protein